MYFKYFKNLIRLVIPSTGLVSERGTQLSNVELMRFIRLLQHILNKLLILVGRNINNNINK